MTRQKDISDDKDLTRSERLELRRLSYEPNSKKSTFVSMSDNVSDDWTTWDAPIWNMRILHHCFFKGNSLESLVGIPASEQDISSIVEEDEGLVETADFVGVLVEAFWAQARLREGLAKENSRCSTPAEIMARQIQLFVPSTGRRPDFFAFLWLTCLIAQGYPDPSPRVEFYENFSKLFGNRTIDTDLKSLRPGWEKLEIWLGRENIEGGLSHQRLILPASIEKHRPHISYSCNLCNPIGSDRRKINSLLIRHRRKGGTLWPSNIALVSYLRRQEEFSPYFSEKLDQHLLLLSRGEAGDTWVSSVLKQSIQGLTFARASFMSGELGPMILRKMDDGGFAPIILPHRDIEHTSLDLSIGDGASCGLDGREILIDTYQSIPFWAGLSAARYLLDECLENLQFISKELENGALLFVPDSLDGLPRLVLGEIKGSVSHLVMAVGDANEVIQRFGGRLCRFWVDGYFVIEGLNADVSALRQFLGKNICNPSQNNRLYPIGGIALHGGYLGRLIGFPDIRVYSPDCPTSVHACFGEDEIVKFNRIEDNLEESSQWRISPDQRPRLSQQLRSLQETITVQAEFEDVETLTREIRLCEQVNRPVFLARDEQFHREDWNRRLGPMYLPSNPPGVPSKDAMIKATRYFCNEDRVRPRFERELFDGLCALFERSVSIRISQFRAMYRRLEPLREAWPKLYDSFLRAWCEGGWLEAGLERGRHVWRLRPINVRLVLCAERKARLIGLTNTQDLIRILALSIDLDISVHPIPPVNPLLPRGWEFRGDIEALAASTGLELQCLDDWVETPFSCAWYVEPTDADGPEWPNTGKQINKKKRFIVNQRRGYHSKEYYDRICHDNLPSSEISIIEEEGPCGLRRWRSSQTSDAFISCHRERVILAALTDETNGLWPFGFPNKEVSFIERLMDVDVHLPLPLGRYSACVGPILPGPTLLTIEKHTYRYHFDEETARNLRNPEYLTLTPLSDPIFS